MRSNRRLLCRCLGIASFRVEEAVAEHGLARVDEITKATGAGGGCATCHPELEEVLADFAGEEVDSALRMENRLVCQAETRARIEGTLESLILPKLAEREITLDGLEIDGLVVRLYLGTRDRAVYDFVAEKLRKYVCRDLEVEALR